MLAPSDRSDVRSDVFAGVQKLMTTKADYADETAEAVLDLLRGIFFDDYDDCGPRVAAIIRSRTSPPKPESAAALAEHYKIKSEGDFP